MAISKEYEEVKSIKNKDKVRALNELVAEIEKRRVDMSSDEGLNKSIEEQVKSIAELKSLIYKRDLLNADILELMNASPDLSDKFYLAEIIQAENPTWGSNNLIVAPVKSGKTTFIEESVTEDTVSNHLILFASENKKEEFLSRYFRQYGMKMITMTYDEFSKEKEDFINVKGFNKIFCDEINWLHSNYKQNPSLEKIYNKLFEKKDGIQFFYLTASQNPVAPKGSELKLFNHYEARKIMRYMPNSMRQIEQLSDSIQYLKDMKTGFKYHGLKGLAIGNSNEDLREIEKIVTKEGYNPLVLISDKKFNEEQTVGLNHLIKTGEIPDNYNFLILDSKTQENQWKLEDESVKFVLLQADNDTEYVQTLGTLYIDIELLVYRTDKQKE